MVSSLFFDRTLKRFICSVLNSEGGTYVPRTLGSAANASDKKSRPGNQLCGLKCLMAENRFPTHKQLFQPPSDPWTASRTTKFSVIVPYVWFFVPVSPADILKCWLLAPVIPSIPLLCYIHMRFLAPDSLYPFSDNPSQISLSQNLTQMRLLKCWLFVPECVLQTALSERWQRRQQVVPAVKSRTLDTSLQ